MTEMFGEAWSPMSVPDLAPDDDDDSLFWKNRDVFSLYLHWHAMTIATCFLNFILKLIADLVF